MRLLYLPNEYSQQRQYEKKRKIYPVLMAMEAEWYRKQGHDVVWGCGLEVNQLHDKVIEELEGLPFLSLPHPDRKFTRWWEYQDNGNFKYLPATYIQSANGCWHGKCTFCVEQNKKYEVRPVEDVISEIEECKSMGFKEVFDDSGTFPTGRWLDEFCKKIKKTNIRISCNMRLCDLDYFALAAAGSFRMVLFGLESANQVTLDKINKGVKVEDIKYIKKAAKCGLSPHVAVMFGFPWESEADAMRTLETVWYLLRKGYAKTAQASFYTPPDRKNQEGHRKFIKRIYRVALSPEFWFRKLRDIHNRDDLKYLWRQIKAGINDTNR